LTPRQFKADADLAGHVAKGVKSFVASSLDTVVVIAAALTCIREREKELLKSELVYRSAIIVTNQ